MSYLAQINISAPKGLENIYNDLGKSSPDLALGDWISKLLQYSIIIAGLIFFVKLISAGFSYMTSAGDSAKVQAATKEITNALIGLLLVVSVFFIKQILETVFGIKIL